MKRIVYPALGVALAALVCLVAPQREARADPGHTGGSSNVAVINSPSVINGGVLPTSGGAFDNFTFTNLQVANVNAANLAAFDTVVLNVASPGMGCTTGTLSASQKADLNAFVAAGGKLIIYDSECTFGGAVDYTWLTYPFSTVNPGATGTLGGTLTIVEENALSSDMVGDTHYIDTNSIILQTDAVGDMNVVDLSTVDPNWCLDMTGTNVLNFSGAVHMYARSGAGLYIYNGLDVDYIGFGTAGAQALAKIWLQELETSASLTDLPCGVAVIGIGLTPAAAVNFVGEDHTVTALLTDIQGVGQPGILVDFTVLSGPNAGASGTCSVDPICLTDMNGQVSFTYTGAGGVGIDQIQACFTNQLGEMICSAVVTKEWMPPPCEPVLDPDVRTQGFWKRICSADHPSGEGANLPGYVDCVNDTMTFAAVSDEGELCERLFPNPKNDKCEQAEAQFMALLLNVCSQRVATCNCISDPYLGDVTVGDAIAFIDGLLSNPMRTFDDCVLAQAIADAINNGYTLVTCP